MEIKMQNGTVITGTPSEVAELLGIAINFQAESAPVVRTKRAYKKRGVGRPKKSKTQHSFNRWTKPEMQYLKKHYNKMQFNKLASKLTRHPVQSIRDKACDLGLTNNK